MVQRVNIRELREVCTYWATQPSDFEDGGYTFEAPLLLKCRWENKVQLVVDDQERKFQSMIQVWVDRPVQTEGFLARTGYTQVVLGFARWGWPKYAIYVHEDPRPYHDPPTQYKFLEEAVNRHYQGFKERVAKATRDLADLD